MSTEAAQGAGLPNQVGHFLLDGEPLAYQPGDSVLSAARRAGRYIPHLCWHPDYAAHGSCRICVVRVGERHLASCTTAASDGLVVQSDTEELRGLRKTLVQMLFVEGNHFCPSCEKSGQCVLQATAYAVGMLGPHFDEFYPNRQIDASHPDVLLDRDRCIVCGLCARASAQTDGKSVFAIGGHGQAVGLLVNSPSGKLGDSELHREDRAAHICPVGALMPKRQGFAIPIGQRRFDQVSIDSDSQPEMP